MGKKENKTGVISQILREGKRVLLHLQQSSKGSQPYFAVASRSAAKNLKAGDTIEYEVEPLAVNFGWFIAKKDAPTEIRTERSVFLRKCQC